MTLACDGGKIRTHILVLSKITWHFIWEYDFFLVLILISPPLNKENVLTLSAFILRCNLDLPSCDKDFVHWLQEYVFSQRCVFKTISLS